MNGYINELKQQMGLSAISPREVIKPKNDTDLCRIDLDWAWCIMVTYRGIKRKGIKINHITKVQSMESYCKDHAMSYSKFWELYKSGKDEFNW